MCVVFEGIVGIYENLYILGLDGIDLIEVKIKLILKVSFKEEFLYKVLLLDWEIVGFKKEKY